ncbi:DUF397 domain-containing protein [Streptomyces avermitilis]|uniref:DUF397 domain-containing protein n=1 Tax=Streptomyces avermitilis TaxID=33903 RepID=UPI0033BEA1AC
MSITESKVDDSPMWFTSSYSNGAGGECVECASSDDNALIRDSKHLGGPVVGVPGLAWHAFVRALKRGELG